MKKLAIISSHPIQYNAPLFQMLTARNKIEIKVFYTFSQSQNGGQYDPGFDRVIVWDIPLLQGYNFSFVKNVSKKPGTGHFFGLVNPTLINNINEWQPNCILIYGWSFKSHLKSILHFKKKIPIVFRGDSNLLDKKNRVKKFARNLFLRWVYKHIDHALYVGLANKLYYLQNGLKEKNISFAPHAIDNERFGDNDHQIEKEAIKRRREMGIDDNDIVFLFAGKLEPKKNPELLFKAFQEMNQKAHLIIVGNGKLEIKLKQNYSLRNIHFIDFQNQAIMPTIYRMGDVFVLPSSGPGETWGLSVNEAMASSRALIVSDMCGCADDLVEIGRNGYVFQSGNINDIVEKMQLVLDKNRVKIMGEESKKIIKDWSFERVCDEIEHLVLVKLIN